ncbi:hypothetical protein NP493_525g02031 [Ridgeia piscesae]|uniref:Uncharacterized protein n=1 Tax=Ridgeia piscesae TaxID=27915 RepID=A0AAD9KWJ9_RIDPI|nr:hypothetical protein NP493_525g02031 [Ridgeia piscesae]
MGLNVERIEKEGDCAALWCRDLDVTPCVVGVFTWPARACDPTTLSSVGAITGCHLVGEGEATPYPDCVRHKADLHKVANGDELGRRHTAAVVHGSSIRTHSNVPYTEINLAAFWVSIDVNVRHLHLDLVCDWCIQQPTTAQVVAVILTSVTSRSKRLWFSGHPQGAATVI